MKKQNRDYRRNLGTPDLVCAVSPIEKSILTNAGFRPEQVHITGLARYDHLDRSGATSLKRTIAFMPTWRDWVHVSDFTGSTFYREVQRLIADRGLEDLLQRTDTVLKFYLHVNMKDFQHAFVPDGRRIEIVRFGEDSVQDMIIKSDILITDYSSISWDFLYLGKPVVFYQFDRDDYLERRGSYLELNDLFGLCAMSTGDVVDALSGILDDYAAESARLSGYAHTHFEYFDHRNCERIFQMSRRLCRR